MGTFLQRMERNEEIREAQSARLARVAQAPDLAAVAIQAKLKGLHCGTANSTINIDGEDFQKMLAGIIIEAIG